MESEYADEPFSDTESAPRRESSGRLLKLQLPSFNLNLKSAMVLDRTVKKVTINKTKFTKVRLRGMGINDLDAMRLAIGLRGNTSVTLIDLGYCNLTAAGAQSLFEALRKNKTLKFLFLDGNKIGKKGARAAAEAILDGKLALTVLDLNGNNIGAGGAKLIARALSSSKTTLEALDLGGNRIRDEGAEEVSKALQNSNSKLRKLGLERNGIGNGAAKLLAEFLYHNRTLRRLDIRGNRISDEGISAFYAEIVHPV